MRALFIKGSERN